MTKGRNVEVGPLGTVLWLRLSPGGGLKCCGAAHYPPTPKQDADIFEVLIRQTREYSNINPVFSKTLRVLDLVGSTALSAPYGPRGLTQGHFGPPGSLAIVRDRQATVT